MKKCSVFFFLLVANVIFSESFIASANDFKVGDHVHLDNGHASGEVVLLLDGNKAAVKTADEMGNPVFIEVDLSGNARSFMPYNDCFQGLCLNQEVFVAATYSRVSGPGKISRFYGNQYKKTFVGVMIASDTDNFTPYEATFEAKDVFPMLGVTCARNFCVGDKYRLYTRDEAEVYVVKKIIGTGILYGQLVGATDSSYILTYSKWAYPAE